MGEQSSRIIWGKNKNPGANDPTPVELYDNNSIYVSGNYAIKSDGNSGVAENYHLYLCTAAETGGDWNDEDWKIQEGVKNYYLIANSKVFKKGARVIKEDTNGDYETMKLYKCIVDKTSKSKGFIPSEWEVVYQDIGLAWIPRDHKDVYYDDGKNSIKWHIKMFYIPPEYKDATSDLEIIDFSEDWQYHFGDRCLFNHPTDGYSCYKYKNVYPRKGVWQPNDWQLQPAVKEYETYKAYAKDDEIFRNTIEVYESYITEYQAGQLKYVQGRYCLSPIDHKYESEQGHMSEFSNVAYRDKIYSGEKIFGLYKCLHTTQSSVFEPEDWELQASNEIEIRGRTYNSQHHDIKQWEFGDTFSIGDLCIWTGVEGESYFVLSVCKKYIATSTKQNWPPNEEYWEPLTQVLESSDIYRVYKAVRDISAENNSHWQYQNWTIVTQKVEMDYDLYGLIWEKYGPVGGGPIPYYFPIVIRGNDRGVSGVVNDYRFDNFYAYSLMESVLIVGQTRATDRRGTNPTIVHESGADKIIAGNLYFYAYNEIYADDDDIDAGRKIFVSKNSTDWYEIDLDYDRFLLPEIRPFDGGFLYAKPTNQIGTLGWKESLDIVKVTIGSNCEKLSEDILETNIIRNNWWNKSFDEKPRQEYYLFKAGNSPESINANRHLHYTCIFSDGTSQTIDFTDLVVYNDSDAYLDILNSFSSHNGDTVYAMFFEAKQYWNSEAQSEYIHALRYLVRISKNDTTPQSFFKYLEVDCDTADFQSTDMPGILSPYVIDDTYAFIKGLNSLWKITLANGGVQRIFSALTEELFNAHVIITGIPYYNGLTCTLNLLNTQVKYLKLCNSRLTNLSDNGEIINNVLKLYFDPSRYFYTAHGSSNVGAPSRTSDLFISDIFTLKNGNLSRKYNVCIYVPNYNGERFSNEGAFFWISGTADSGGPFFGGPGQEGF